MRMYCRYKAIFRLLFLLSIVAFAVVYMPVSVRAVEIERFDRLDTKNGLSQNNVQSLFCDHYGFIWAGTMNGLNRFDGYNFKVYKSEPGRENTLTQNRVINLFEDSKKVLWLETNDKYYHYFIRETEEFISFPYYNSTRFEANSIITSFFQYSDDQVILGSSRSGLYWLTYDDNSKQYTVRQFQSPSENGQDFSNIRFILQAPDGGIVIGTETFLYHVTKASIENGSPVFQLISEKIKFTSGVFIGDTLWAGSQNFGILAYSFANENTILINEKALSPIQNITFLQATRDNRFLCAGTYANGFFIFDMQQDKLVRYETGGYEAQYIYEDLSGLIWLKTRQAGVLKIDPLTKLSKHFDLIPAESNPLADDEQTLFFEDSKGNLWISNQGTGLGWYNRSQDKIRFFRYDHLNPSSLRSNHILCMIEDKTGTLWVGTAHSNGGLNRVVMANPAFQRIELVDAFKDESENLVRSLMVDRNNYLWAGTKAGAIHISRNGIDPVAKLIGFDKKHDLISGYNAYAIFQDEDGYIWIGTKGGGVSVSEKPLGSGDQAYQQLRFQNYRFDALDEQSLSSNNVYSIAQDKLGQIWIGTFNGGLNRVLKRDKNRLVCQRYTGGSHQLSSPFVRHVLVDNDNRLWVGTNFGVNVATIQASGDITQFENLIKDPSLSESLGYSDVVHLLQDSRGWYWMATFGGGINLLKSYVLGAIPVFEYITMENGLVNDAVYAIEEDNKGNIWFSTEKGLARYLSETSKIENFGKNSGLVHENFCENTSSILNNGDLFFGNLKGIIKVQPEKIELSSYKPKIVMVKLVINNKDVSFLDGDSPLTKPLEESDQIILNHNQINFSIEFSALDFKAPEAIRYQYRLDPFDADWTMPSEQRIATYTNMSPGKYTLRVRATNSDGVWSDQEAQLFVVITPPFWRQWWFRALVLLLIVLGIYMYIHQRDKNFSRTKRLLELTVEERTREILAQKEKIETQNHALEEANSLKDRFFNIIAHDLINPVNAFCQLSEQLAENYYHLSEHERLKMSAFVYKSAQSIQTLLEELLIWARAQTNRIEYNKMNNNLSGMVNQVVGTLIGSADAKQIVIKNDYCEPVIVFCDVMTISTVIRNLLANAIKFSHPGSYVVVGCTIEGDFVKVYIKDFGIGIPEQVKPKLFMLGEKITSKGTADEAGTGLGLYICYEFVKGNGGTIGFESEKGKGSTFWFTLPKQKI